MNWMLLTDDQQEHLERVISEYVGDGDVLERAVGALFVGKVYGWRVLRVMHTSVTYAKYQRVLDVDFKRWCPDETKLSMRNGGYRIVSKLKDFWMAVRKQVPLPEELKEERNTFS